MHRHRYCASCFEWTEGSHPNYAPWYAKCITCGFDICDECIDMDEVAIMNARVEHLLAENGFTPDDYDERCNFIDDLLPTIFQCPTCKQLSQLFANIADLRSHIEDLNARIKQLENADR